jgi:hypothetical protein
MVVSGRAHPRIDQKEPREHGAVLDERGSVPRAKASAAVLVVIGVSTNAPV